MSQSALKDAIESNDLDAAALILREIADLSAEKFEWGMPPLAASRSPEMVDLLVENGAETEAVSQWWSQGFGAHLVSPTTAEYLLELGASISPHAAAAIGLVDELRALLADDPSLAHAPGGDGGTPLHFARSCEVAENLLNAGADPNARDEDHDSTPAQWRIKDSPDVVRLLLDRGARPDIFLAAALGDFKVAESLLKSDPDCTDQRIGYNRGAFPGIGHNGRGGTIYQWTLGFNLTPHEVALKNGHEEMYAYLFDHSSRKQQFLVACTIPNRTAAEAILAENPTIIQELDVEDQSLLAKFCWETNISIEAVRLMLDVGFPVDVPESNHGFMALHNAAWCGNPELVKLLLDRGHPTDRRDPEFNATAIGFAIHSCTEAKRHPDGKFHQVLRLLIDAGVQLENHPKPVSDAAIDAMLQQT